MKDNIQLTSAYRLNGVGFWESAKTLSKDMEKKEDGTPQNYLSVPYYFLISQGIELLLKSALAKRGWNEDQLKQYEYRHNLEALFSEVINLGLVFTEETKNLVCNLSAQHATHLLRYFDVFADRDKVTLPSTNTIDQCMEELLLATRISTQGR